MLMDQQHPITPPPELVREWNEAAIGTRFPPYGYSEYIATKAARWGADQELEACCEHLRYHQWGFIGRFDGTKVHRALDLKLARRPKPPSLAEEALKALQDQIDASFKLSPKAQERVDLICAALERLQELEEGNE